MLLNTLGPSQPLPPSLFPEATFAGGRTSTSAFFHPQERLSAIGNMAASKVLLLAALTVAALVAAATAVADQELAAADVQETFLGAKTASRIPVPNALCQINYCGTTTVTVLSTYWYWWYGPTLYSPGSTTPDDGTTFGVCPKVPWCPGCYRCRVYKRSKCVRTYPYFTKGKCPRKPNLPVSARLATSQWTA